MADVKVIGQMDNTIDHTFESANRVYDVGGVAPAMNTCGGGGLQPKILETKQLGFMDSGTGKHQSNTVYDENALCPNITTIEGGGTQQIKICESQIVAMRGRNPDNPSDRTVGSPTEQRLEVNMQGTSNCLTSVQKDNLVMESQVLTPKRTEYGKQIRKAYESGQIQESRHNMTELEPRRDNMSNTLTTVQKDNLLLEKQGISTKGRQNDVASTILSGYERSNMTGFNADNAVIEKVGQISSNGSQCGTVISDNGISANLVAGTHGYANSHIATQYRIRKLTPRECGRLMGVSDEDIDKMAAVNSNTQLYKQFGNSIVVDVMCAMFENLNINQL